MPRFGIQRCQIARLWPYKQLGTINPTVDGTYSTNFPLTENPISENGYWLNGATVGLDWLNVRTTPGKAFGTGVARHYNDSTALLAGTWASDQSAEATVYTIEDSSVFEEVELRLRSSISAHNCSGYEINFSVKAGRPYCQIGFWNGPLGDFETIGTREIGVRNGDTVKATAIGSVITAYINGRRIFSVTNSRFSEGSPGIGFYLEGGDGPPANFGFTNFTATGLIMAPSPTPTATATATASFTPTPTSTPTPTPTP